MTIKIKRLIKKIFGIKGQTLIANLLVITKQNNKHILFTTKKARKNKVNLNYCHDFKNIGDNISPILVEYAAKTHNIDINQDVKQTKHLFAVGSIITAGAQDCTVWGSGLLNTKILGRLYKRKLDIRSVRGPLSRIVLMDQGYYVPEVYGDPAILMPLIYDAVIEKTYPISVITHTNEKVDLPDAKIHIINVKTSDYKTFVEEIKASEVVISSSLHGIIFAESYGVPAIMLRPQVDLFKYYDYYYSTNRYSFPIAETVAEALDMRPAELPDFTYMREGLLRAFPKDLWVV